MLRSPSILQHNIEFYTIIDMEKINKRNLKIMIIEDEEDILILYKDFLSGKGHDVTTMYLNGDLIIEEIDKARSDLYLIDYRLPGNKNGIDIATQILDKFPLSPILFITAHENLYKEISKNPIFDGKNIEVLLKPVKLDKIENSIVALMNKNQVS